VKDELDRWVDLEGPPPEGVRRLLDAACEADRLKRLDAKVLAAVAEDRRRWARRRALKRALGGLLVAVCMAGAGVVAVRLAGKWDLAGVQRSMSDATRRDTLPRDEPKPPAHPVPATTGPPDAGRPATP